MAATPYVLHEFSRSSSSWRVRIVLNLKGSSYQTRSYRLREGEHRRPAAVPLVYGTGLVPTLELPDGRVLWQSLAIAEYLDEVHPAPALLPADPAGRARVRALALDVACDIHPLQNLRVLQELRTRGAGPEDVASWLERWLGDGLTAIERRLAADPRTGLCCHGDAPTLADACLVPQVGSARRFGVDLSHHPTVRRIAEHCAGLDPFRMAEPARHPEEASS